MKPLEYSVEKTPNVIELETIDIEIPKLLIDKKYKEHKEPIRKISFNGFPLDLNLRTFLNSFENDVAAMAVNIRLRKNKKYIANLDIGVLKTQDSCVVDTYVLNENHQIKGLGRALWKLSLKFIQKFADEWNINVIHKITKRPSEGLTPEKWDELFIPILNEFGYTRLDDHNWEKVYSPK